MGVLDGVLNGAVSTVLGLVGPSGVILTQRLSFYNASSDQKVETTRDYPIVCSPRDEYNERDVDGDRIKMGDFKVMIAAEGLPITPNSQNCIITINGRKAYIINVNPIEVGATAVSYEVHCRY